MKLGLNCGACSVKFQSPPPPSLVDLAWLDMCERASASLPLSTFNHCQPYNHPPHLLPLTSRANHSRPLRSYRQRHALRLQRIVRLAIPTFRRALQSTRDSPTTERRSFAIAFRILATQHCTTRSKYHTNNNTPRPWPTLSHPSTRLVLASTQRPHSPRKSHTSTTATLATTPITQATQ